jgi:hypothetical protein
MDYALIAVSQLPKASDIAHVISFQGIHAHAPCVAIRLSTRKRFAPSAREQNGVRDGKSN